MARFATGLLGGVTVGIIVGAGLITATDSKQRRRMMRDSRRAVRKAGHYISDIFE
ncbi:MAG: hypothetical protein LBI27_06590 [Clostridiales bacterium]|jgi:gas vesicle protein|nr:hypothetical protein [Clostridiales bacterium]